MPRRSAASFEVPSSVTGELARLTPPADLDKPEREIFLDLVSASKPGHFRASDLPLLSAYVRAIALERRSASELAAGDTKALTRWERAVKSMVALSMRLRLSPQSRAANNPTRPGTESMPSYFDRMTLLEGVPDD